MKLHLAALALTGWLSAARADIDVQVGLNGQLRFSPETVFGQPGELVNFHFHGSTHTASESTARLRDPCNTEGGFDSGIQKDGSVYTILISTHNSIYVHCTPHCGDGMVMIVNPGPNDSVDTFRSVAAAAVGGSGGPGSTTTSSTVLSSSTSTSNSATSTIPPPPPPSTHNAPSITHITPMSTDLSTPAERSTSSSTAVTPSSQSSNPVLLSSSSSLLNSTLMSLTAAPTVPSNAPITGSGVSTLVPVNSASAVVTLATAIFTLLPLLLAVVIIYSI